MCFPVCDSVFLVLPWDKKKWSRWTKLVACKSDIPLSKADGNHGGIVMQGVEYVRQLASLLFCEGAHNQTIAFLDKLRPSKVHRVAIWQ